MDKCLCLKDEPHFSYSTRKCLRTVLKNALISNNLSMQLILKHIYNKI